MISDRHRDSLHRRNLPFKRRDPFGQLLILGVVVGDLIGTGAAQEQAVGGETPNLAARLQAVAEPGAVVISASTHGLTGGLFDYRDLWTATLKGFAENVSAWQVLGVSAAESRSVALRAITTPLVGREEEIDLLMRRWEQSDG